MASGIGSLAQAGDVASDLAPYVAGGGSTVAVAAVAYLLRMFSKGELVSKPVHEYQRELGVLTQAGAEREEALMRIAEQQRKMLTEAARRQEDTNRVLWRLSDHLGLGADPRRERKG